MKDLLKMLRLPLALETANVLSHRVAHWTNFGGAYVDTARILLSAAIVFYVGWIISRQTKRFSQALVAALLVWAFSLMLVVLLMATQIFFEPVLPASEGAMAIGGYVLVSILILPVVLAVAASAAMIARRTAF